MAENKKDTLVEAKAASPEPTAPLAERMATQKATLLDMQKQLQMQLNGVANQLFLIEQLENPGVTLDPNTGKPVEAPPETPSNATPDGTI